MVRRRVRVLFVRPALGQGGADRVTITLLQHLDRSRFEPHLALMRKEGEFVEDVPEDVPVYDLEALSLWSSWRPLTRLVRHQQPDVLMSTSGGMNMPAAVADLLAPGRRRLVLSERNVVLHGERTPARLLQLAAKRLLYRRADSVAVISAGLGLDVQDKLRIDPPRTPVVYNPAVTAEVSRGAAQPVDHPWFHEDGKIVLGVGRLVPQKDFRTLIDAFALVRKRVPARLVILGEGPLRADLAQHARDGGVDHLVALAGYDKNPFKYMARADVFAFSSRHEGLGNALIQAMACGTAVVSTDCPSGPNEIVTEGHDGYLVPVGDASALADRIVELLTDDELRRRMGTNAAASAERFSTDAVVARYEAVLSGHDLPNPGPGT